MSTNKTENYGLHAWVAGDDFLREEINENFALLDASARLVMGMYTGSGTASRDIDLGFAPKAVLLVDAQGRVTHNGYYCGGLALAGFPVQSSFNNRKFKVVELTSQGFQVYYTKLDNNTYAYTNQENVVFHYIALV